MTGEMYDVEFGELNASEGKDVLAHITWWEQDMISEILYGIEIDPGLNSQPSKRCRAGACLCLLCKRFQPGGKILKRLCKVWDRTPD